MRMPSRREFLYAAGAIGTALSGPLARGFGAAAPANVRVRKDIATLDKSSPEISDLRKAVEIMKDPSTKHQTWAEWALIHGVVNGPFNKCQHHSWFFLPWHRMYVYFFEQHVAKLAGNPDFALPYWNWTKDPAVPDLFWEDPFLDTTRAVKQGEKVGKSEYDMFLSKKVISDILDLSPFSLFGGNAMGSGGLEQTPHNFIHNWVGGDMATAGSPTDPVFWVHHCNCDRLYSAWTSQSGHVLPGDTGWNDREFKDFFGKGMKVSDTNNTDGPPMNYTYDTLSPAAAIELIAVEGPAEKAGRLDGAAVVFTLGVKGRAAAAVRRATAGAADSRNGSVALVLEGIKVPDNQNVRVSVLLNAPNPGPDLPATDPHYVTSFTFFHGAHGGEARKDGHGDGTVTRLVDATRTLKRLFGATGYPEGEPLNVQIVAAPLFPGRDNPWRGTVQELSPAQVRIVAYVPRP